MWLETVGKLFIKLTDTSVTLKTCFSFALWMLDEIAFGISTSIRDNWGQRGKLGWKKIQFDTKEKTFLNPPKFLFGL